MTRILTKLLPAGVMMLMSIPAALADECDESPDCPEGQVCEMGECLVVPAECATFCENFSPCFSSGGVECTGSGMINDAGELVDVVEECHPYEGTKDLMEDCLSDCASAMQDDESKALMTTLMNCLEEADYDCGAKGICGERAEMGGRSMGDDDVVSKSGGSDTSVSESGEGSSSCSMSSRQQAHRVGAVLLFLLVCLVIVGRRDGRRLRKT